MRPISRLTTLLRKAKYIGKFLATGCLFISVAGARGQEGPQQPPPQAPASTPATSSQNPISNAQPVLSPDTSAQATVRKFRYNCDNDVQLTVTYRGSAARVSYNGHVYAMKQTLSADGGRYSDGKLVWWSKGDGGFLAEVDDTSPTGGKQLAVNCHATTSAATSDSSAPAATPGVVTGTVGYLNRMAMPPTAVAVVQLQDISRADAAATTVTEAKITFGDRQVPIPFELKFDPAQIDAKHRYAVRATIVVDGARRFQTDTVYPVITHGHPSTAALVLKPVA